MIRFLLSRLVQGLITVWALSFVIFVIGRATGNPAYTILPPGSSQAQVKALTEQLGLGKPLLDQYWSYLDAFVHGNFGTSVRTGGPVVDIVIPRLLNSLRLISVGYGLAIVVSLPLAVTAAVKPNRIVDRVTMLVALIGQSVPSFFMGLLLILVFAVKLRWLPAAGISGWTSYILPGVTLAWFLAAGMIRLTRSSMLEVLGEDYVRTARAKGLGSRAVAWKHAARNALLPVITYFGLMFGVSIASSITTEVIFNFPGLGYLAYQAVEWRDFPLLQFTVVMWALIIVSINLIVDIAYVFIDPRIRLTKTQST